MDTTYSSGEEFVVKTRKPYTITKQRERWTEDEHNRFLEALKLYGRAWQRIEEHIGTKTAVQIRSHAQKFFSKLEKEALVKGVPVGQTLDIDIPPPRPKRKPSNPYPRKTCQGTPMSLVGAKDGKFLSSQSSHSKQMLDLEKEQLHKKPGGEGKITHDKENQSDNCSEVLTQLQGTHYSSACNSSAPKPPVGLGNACSFREFVPSFRKTNQDDTNCSYVTVELTRSQNVQKPDAKDMIIEDSDTSNGLLLEETNALSEKFVAGDKMGSDVNCGLPTEEMQATQNYPRHVPVHVVDGSLGTSQNHSPDMPFREPKFHPGLVGEVHGHPNFFASSAASATTEHLTNAPRSSGQQSFQPFNPSLTSTCPNQEDYQSFLHVSSTFSSLILSTLLQNPAAHAAASFAATFWPYSNGKASADSPALNQGGFSLRQSNSAPSMAAIAAATVAAATAWWASHGLLPLCAPLHTTYTCTTPVGGAPSIETSQVLAAKTGENSLNPPLQDQMEPGYAEALQNQHSASKSSSNSEKIGAAKLNPSEGSKLNSNSKDAADDNAAETAELQDSKKAKGGKQVDRSSCGSNTASSSDIETDALGKKENGVEELEEPENSNPISDTNIRRSRSNSNSTDSWKEVSEEGRLAFQALFSREVLPQSFSPPPNMKTQENQNDSMKLDRENEEKDGVTSLLDLNIKAWGFCFNLDESEKNGSPTGNKLTDGQLTMGIGQGRFKARRTGFKPYKRCSVEAKENRVGNPGCQVEEKGTKRIRLEGEVQL